MSNDYVFVFIAGIKVAVREEVTIISILELEGNSFIQGYCGEIRYFTNILE